MAAPEALTIDWRAISILGSVALAWNALLFAAIRALLSREIQSLDKRFEGINRRFEDLAGNHEEDKREWQRIERELLTLRAELPKQYVMREDWIRAWNVIDAKQDTLNEKIQRLLERGNGRSGTSP